MDSSNSTQSPRSGDPTQLPQTNNSEQSLPKPPSLRPSLDNPSPAMTSSSAPLGPVMTGRRPGPVSQSSGFNPDISKKLRDMVLNRGQSGQNVRQDLANGPSSSSPHMRGGPPSGGPMAGPHSAGGPPMGGMNFPPNMQRPSVPNPRMNPRMNLKGPGGLAEKRGLNRGMKLSDAMKPATDGEPNQKQETDMGSQFKKFESVVDVNKGTLNFKNKAVVHSGGIDFHSGSTFSISLDDVQTIGELGKGNYGTVFKVRHAKPTIRRPGQGLRGNRGPGDSNGTDEATGETTGLIMAMKELRLELEDAKFAQIIMELDILHRCLSPFIIDFYGAFFQEGSVYICIEYMDGGSIDKIYGDGVPEEILKKLTLSTVMGLKYLKDEHNIIHRDVKPTNILVNTRGQFKICDFGVSGNLVASIARTNIGCQSYMAPERISGGGMAQAGATGGGTYSVQSDIWSLGLSIIECALGRYPYPPETYDNIFSQLSAIVDGEPPDLPANKYSETSRDFVRGCLNKVPKMRPTYAALIRHPWLSPLMQPPTISEDEEAEKIAEAGGNASSADQAVSDTFDKEVGEWVKAALERKRTGKMGESAKPALHAAPLDAVAATSPLADTPPTHSPIVPNPGVLIESPELKSAKVQSMDFASGVEPDSTS